MGSSQVFDEEKSYNAFNDDSFDDSLNQSECFENNLTDYINPEFIINIQDKIPSNSQDNSDAIFPKNQVEDNFSSNSYNTNSTGNRRGRRTNNLNIQHPSTKNDCRMAKIQIGYSTFLIIFINTVMKKLKLNYFFFPIRWKN